MSDTIERLKGEDFQEAMEAMGTAFGFAPDRDFPMLLPQIYRPTDELMQALYAIRRDGRIVSIVGSHPRDWQVGDTMLKLGGIGGVATLSEYRGEGLMKALMDRAVANMKSEGYHLSWLGGHRHRYQYYGYEKCGYSLQYSLRQVTLRHAGQIERDITFVPMGEHYTEQVKTAKSFHEAKPVHVRRSQDDFMLYLISGYCKPWAALDTDDRMIGYISVRDGGVREIASESTQASLDILFAWARKTEQDVNVTVQPSDVGLARSLSEVAEGVSVNGTGNWQIYDWEATLDALMRVKHATAGSIEGECRIAIGEERFKLFVTDDRVGCQATEEVPDLKLTPFQAHRFLFGPTRPSEVIDIPDAARAVESWLPLPLSFLRADSV
jgi:GNAT superfamily N-acetyltransferase